MPGRRTLVLSYTKSRLTCCGCGGCRAWGWKAAVEEGMEVEETARGAPESAGKDTAAWRPSAAATAFAASC